ncbi:MAG: tyrosine-type recombinase/integrase [Pseudomonadota bacterium]
MSTKQPNQWVGKRLTKRIVDSVPPPESGQLIVRDAELKGFALRVTPGGAKTFVVEKRIGGKVRRIKIARYPEKTCEEARLEAQQMLGQIAGGIDPNKKKRQSQFDGIILHEVYKAFRQARRHLAPKTLYDYQRVMDVVFSDWMAKPVRGISKDMVAKRFQQLSDQHGPHYANLAMRILRALLNFARDNYEDDDGQPIILDNPVNRLTRTRVWHPTQRRQTVIRPHQLAAFYTAVQRLKTEEHTRQGETVADYLMTLLFTGLRRSEAANLRWSDVDLEHRTLTIRQTKNGQPLTLPLSDYLWALLSERQAEAQTAYVFPGQGHPGALVEPRAGVQWVIQESGVKFTLHDLRRTFITTATGLGVHIYLIKRLVNHKLSNDVTEGYTISDVEHLRESAQKIADFLAKACGILPSADVIDLEARKSLQ